MSHDSTTLKRKWLPTSVVKHVELIKSIAAMALACNLLSSETMGRRETEFYVYFLFKYFILLERIFQQI